MTAADFSYFEQFSNFEKSPARSPAFQLERMASLLEDHDSPQENMAFVHIAGSKGKGITSAFMAALLSTALGETVGIYSSPHVHDYRERIRMALPSVTDYRRGFFPTEVYTEGIEQIKKQHGAAEDRGATTFELLTLLALLIFRSQNLSWAVMEVGLGGRLDSTNIILPRLSIISPLELEHCQYLGNSIEEIAWEKAGIIKAGIPVLSQNQKPEAARVIARRAEELAAPCFFCHELIGSPRYKEFLAALKQQVPYMRENAGLAYMGFTILAEQNIVPELSPRQAAEIIGHCTLRGRFEKHLLSPLKPGKQGQKLVFLDAAHTPNSITAFLAGLEPVRKNYPQKTCTIIFSALEDKDCRTMLEKIMPACDDLVITGCGNFKRANTAELARLATVTAEKMRLPLPHLIANPLTAFHKTIENDKNDIVVVCGSFYLLGEIYKALKQYGKKVQYES